MKRDLGERDEDAEEEHDDPHAAAQVALEHETLDEARALEAREVAVPVLPDRGLCSVPRGCRRLKGKKSRKD